MKVFSNRIEFAKSLCTDHLDETAFLYTQIRHLLSDKSPSPWLCAGKFEARLTAHLDALLIEGDLAVETCQNRVESTDPGDLYAAVRIGFRNDRFDLVDSVLNKLPPDHERKIAAVCDALIHETGFHPKQVCKILKAHPERPDIWIRVAGDARLADAWPPPESTRYTAPGPLVRFAGRIGEDVGIIFTQSLCHENVDVRSEAALALLRLGKRQELTDHCWSEEKAIVALGVCGGPKEVSFLLELAQRGPVTDELLISLGLLGDKAAVPLLIKCLSDETLAPAAAEALELITGADLKEEIFVPDPIDEKELFKEELERFKKGESPYPPGKEPGVTVTRISRNSGAWENWLRERIMLPGTRYRNGEPLTPWSLIRNLKSETLPQYLRQLAYEELVIRYRKDIPFETDMPTAFQEKAIASYEDWAQIKGNNFQKGGWYFAGRPLSSKEIS